MNPENTAYVLLIDLHTYIELNLDQISNSKIIYNQFPFNYDLILSFK
jgi:hypothetical protein